jgi:hypothetical protein
MSSTFYTIFVLMVKSLHDFGGLKFEDLGGKVVNMGCNGSNIF